MEARAVRHPAADALKAFGLGKLDDASADTILRHLDGCPQCRAAVASLSGDDFLTRLRQAKPAGSTPAPAKTLERSLRRQAVARCTTGPARLARRAGEPRPV